MLARAHRLVRADDYRNTVRRGGRVALANTMTYVSHRGGEMPARFGFIVAKSVGGAVVRNRVRRQLKAASFMALPLVRSGTDIVVRALPGSAQASWATLHDEIFEVVARDAAKS